MSYDPRKTSGHDCPPPPEDPADQPHEPQETECQDPPPGPEAPPLDPPAPCPDSTCDCPKKPPASANCLQDLIDDQAKQVTVAEEAGKFKAELDGILKQANTAVQAYTRARYDELIKLWLDEDKEIVDLIRKVVCAVPCWRCVIECYICPLLNELHYAEERLYGDGTLYSAVHNLYDLRYWRERDLDAKQRTLDRIKAVLAAWQDPYTTITNAINTGNKTLITKIKKSFESDPAKAVYDLFFVLIPMHLAIAPPATTSGLTTGIGKVYTVFCECDKGTSDVCCGPNVGPFSLRERLIGPQPYLIDPDLYFKIICCLVQHRYVSAKKAVANAKAAFNAVDNEIKRGKEQLDKGLKSFGTTATDAIPAGVKCCGSELDLGDQQSNDQKPTSRR